MGSQIAALGAIGGLQVTLCDISRSALEKAELEIRRRLTRMQEKRQLDHDSADEVLALLDFSSNIPAAAAKADFVIEAIAESLTAKEQLFRQLDAALRPGVIIASNSSSLVSSTLASVTDRPELVVNMHFFNPPLVMDCVEVAGHEGVSEETIEVVKQVAEVLHRQAIHIKKEIPGLIANRLLAVLFREAIRLYEGGYASPEEIDTVCRKALRHPLGPFQLLDLGGIDVNLGMQNLLYEQTGDQDFLPQETITRMAAQELLGRKTGKGFYEYV